jgi:hypothetical protein
MVAYTLGTKGGIIMKKNLVEMVMILDRSGSMAGLEHDVIAGFNDILEKQKELSGEAILSTVLFDDQFEVIHSRLPIQSIKPLTRKQYFVRGSTALLDAIGRGIYKIHQTHNQLPKENVPEKTIFFIHTDGMENSSHEFTFKRLRGIITMMELEHQWQFIFLGANIDAIATASMMGIDASRAANYVPDGQGTKIYMHAVNKVMQDVRSNKTVDANWKEEIDLDFEKRKK